MSAKYTILVEADLDQAESQKLIQQSLKNLSQSIGLEIKNLSVTKQTVDDLRTHIENTLGPINVKINTNPNNPNNPNPNNPPPPPPIYNQNQAYIDFLNQVNTLEAQGMRNIKQTLSYQYDMNGQVERLTAATVEFNDQQGQLVRQTWGWVEASNQGANAQQKVFEWQLKTGKAIDDIAKAEKIAAAEAKKVQDYWNDIANQVKKAQEVMDKTNSLTLNKASGNKQVKDVVAANVELKRAIDDVNLAVSQGIKPTQQQLDNLQKTKTASQNAGNALRTAGKDANSWSHEIGIALKRTIEWAGAMTLLYGSLRQLKEGIQFIKDLNKELTNIQIVAGYSKDEVASLSREYNGLAKELGSTTLEVARGSLEWVRQGKTAEETATLLRNSTMMSKLANIEAAQSTGYMTSIMNGFQLEANDMMGVLDQLVALDNAYATSVAEISDAMQRSSNSAMQSGVSLTQLASYITILSSTTRKSAESIGESLKTMFARFQNIKMGNLDEDGVSLNNVEEALARVNIQLRDSPTSFKDLSVVIEELGGKWKNLNEIEQANLAVQIAGKMNARTYSDIWAI